MMLAPSANHMPTHAATDQAHALYTHSMDASLKATRSAPLQARTARKHGHLQVTEGPHGGDHIHRSPGHHRAPATALLMMSLHRRASGAPNRRLPASQLPDPCPTRVVKGGRGGWRDRGARPVAHRDEDAEAEAVLLQRGRSKTLLLARAAGRLSRPRPLATHRRQRHRSCEGGVTRWRARLGEVGGQ